MDPSLPAHSLPLPRELQPLVETGHWPRDYAEAQRQNSKPIVDSSRVSRTAANETMLYLEPPPFVVLSHEASLAESFWKKYGRLTDIDPDRTLVCGDFGIGSDTPLVLAYDLTSEPRILRLRWSAGTTSWVDVAPSFKSLVELLDLWHTNYTFDRESP